MKTQGVRCVLLFQSNSPIQSPDVWDDRELATIGWFKRESHGWFGECFFHTKHGICVFSRDEAFACRHPYIKNTTKQAFFIQKLVAQTSLWASVRRPMSVVGRAFRSPVLSVRPRGHLPPEAGPEEARGSLEVRVSAKRSATDPTLDLRRNAAASTEGELKRCG